ncbi:MAG: glycosyltransferase family 2 protein [Candidatus Amulumruptor caecigallinarius]|nr:glycosyltransferase family 2 protein [Candidatus Amulumruptor caecigallinarius]MCM1396974.1 glycosyltransferase family 2 protein [Candidatus Amulumruptor caecigallinarius]MCM1453980.1 glycosyltransferase family 2 protein [bacterium]
MSHTPEAPLVSVVIPNYNYLRFLPQRINSVLDQTFTDFELILLDDKSTDGSAEYLRTFEGHPKVSRVIINTDNSGSPFKQWAKGIEAARGRYVWIAEADDLAAPDFLARTVGLMEAHPDMTLAMTMSELIDADGHPGCREYFEEFDPDGASEVYDGKQFVASTMFHSNTCYNASMVLFRRDAWLALPDKEFLNMRYCGDWRMWAQLMLMGSVGLVRERLNSFRFHGNSVTDEGASNARGNLEARFVQLYLASYPGLFSRDEWRMTRYRMWRDWRRQQRRPSPRTAYTASFTPQMFEIYSMHGRLRWTGLWIYSHFLRWGRSTLGISQSWPTPLRTYPAARAPRA